MKKILYFITTSEWGGASRYVYELCKYEKFRGNEVYLVVGSQGKLSDKVSKLGVKVFIVESVKRNIDPLNDFESIFKVRKLVKKIKPDIVHLNSSKAGIIGRIACKGIKTKVVFTVHGWSFTDGIPSAFKRKLFRNVEKVVSGFTDLFICVSNYDEKIGMRDGVLNTNSNVRVIHNGSKAPRENNVNYSVHSPIRLVMVARFSPQKDHETLIKAVAKLPKDSYELTFVGNGETLQYNKKLVSQYGLTNNVKFVGFKDDISEYLINNDIYILSTHYEGLPISIIEAMSYGLPVLATNVGGNSELVENNINGFLFTSKSELIDKLTFIINNPGIIKKMGKQSYRIFSDKYYLSSCLNKVNNAYAKLIDNRS